MTTKQLNALTKDMIKHGQYEVYIYNYYTDRRTVYEDGQGRCWIKWYGELIEVIRAGSCYVDKYSVDTRKEHLEELERATSGISELFGIKEENTEEFEALPIHKDTYQDIMEVCEKNDLTPAELIDCLMGLIDVVKENNAWD